MFPYLYRFPTNIGVELQPSTPWLMARVKCSGYESRLVDCAHVNYTSTLPPGVRKLQMWLMCVGVAASGNDSVQGIYRYFVEVSL